MREFLRGILSRRPALPPAFKQFVAAGRVPLLITTLTASFSALAQVPPPDPACALTSTDIGMTGESLPASVLVCNGDAVTVSMRGNHYPWESDQLNFGYLAISGDFDMKVRISSLRLEAPPGFSHAWAGLMVRENLNQGSRYHALFVEKDASAAEDNYYAAFRRAQDGGGEAWKYLNGAVPYPNAWLRLKRQANTFTAYRSNDGVNWELVAHDTPAVPYSCMAYVGLSTVGFQGTATVEYHDLAFAPQPADTTPPALISAGSLNGSSIGLRFSEPVDRAAAQNPANYQVNGTAGLVTSATLRLDQQSVELGLASVLNAPYTVAAINISDCAGNVGGGSASGTVEGAALVSVDIAGPGDPPVGGSAFVCSGNTITVSEYGGHYPWESELFNFVCQPVSGDFDVKVRISSLGLEAPPGFSQAWAGLMVRENLGQGSRYHALFANRDPYGADDAYFAAFRGGAWKYVNGAVPYPNAWLRLKRQGNTFTVYRGTDGVNWELLAEDNPSVSYSSMTYVGLSTIGFQATTTVEYDDFSLVSTSDTTPPTITCPANIVQATDAGQCSAIVNYTVAAFDDSGSATVVSSPPSGSTFPKGTTTVNSTATDGSGNQSSCSFSVTVNDAEKPTISCPGNITLGCSVDSLTPVNFSATAHDNCDPNPTLTYSIAPGSGFPAGTTTITCTARDASGNQSSCNFTVTRAALDFTGFLSPIGGADANGGSFASPLRTFKLNSTIPVKFAASCGGSPVLSGIHRLQVLKYADQTTAGDAIDATPTDGATTGDEFRLTNEQWHFNLDTKATGMSAGIWLLRATLSDESQHSVWIQIK